MVVASLRRADNQTTIRWFETFRLTSAVPALPELSPALSDELTEILNGSSSSWTCFYTPYGVTVFCILTRPGELATTLAVMTTLPPVIPVQHWTASPSRASKPGNRLEIRKIYGYTLMSTLHIITSQYCRP